MGDGGRNAVNRGRKRRAGRMESSSVIKKRKKRKRERESERTNGCENDR